MKVFLIDTCVASALFDKYNSDHQQAWSFFQSHPESIIYVPAVTWAEIRYGYKIHKNVDLARKEAIESQMQQYEVLNIDKHVSEPYSEIRSRLFDSFGTRVKRGKIKQKRPEELLDKTTGEELGIDENDLWIVAIAVYHNLEFVTTDRMSRIKEVVSELRKDFVFWDYKKN